MDWDQEALDMARDRLRPFASKTSFYCANFRDMDLILSEEGEAGFDGILMDLGLSSFQIDSSGRGFSFMRDEPLDMRMDTFGTIMASDMVNGLSEERLAELIRLYGEERWARRISRAIVRARGKRPLETTAELAGVILRAVPGRGRIHPATRTFQAIRISLNRELESLRAALPAAVGLLRKGGRIVVISFHSLEDRIVKWEFRRLDREEGVVKIITRKPLRPSYEEARSNPRSRSARFRAAEKL